MRSALVAGALAAKAGNGGNAWSRLSLVHGLRRLGFAVTFVEELPGATDKQRAFFDDVCARHRLDGVLLDGDTPCPEGGHDVAVDFGGHLLRHASLRRAARVRILYDDDPVYTQAWHAQGLLGERLDGFDAYFTTGTNVGRPGCRIPADGVEWLPTLPPVAIDEWPEAPAEEAWRFTTVASWRGGYGRLELDGELLGQKAHEWRALATLPERSGESFEVALAIDDADAADADLLLAHGWRLVDPARAAGTTGAYRRYLSGSGAECSPAQGAYVTTASGWVSDRTAHYLAAGKPALVQDTGQRGEVLPHGEGLLTFATLDEAVAGVRSIRTEYERHVAAARSLAERLLDAELVVGSLLERAGAA